MDRDEEIYYKELHQTARHYDTKLWTVLGVSLVVVGWLATGLDVDDFISLKNIPVLLTAGVVSCLLLLKFIKEHAHTLWIQKKINAFDDQENEKQQTPEGQQNIREKLKMRRPLFSLPPKRALDGMFSTEDIIAELKELKQSKTPYFNRVPGHEKLLQKEVSKWFMWLMLIVSWSSFTLVGVILLIEFLNPNLVCFFECANKL